VRKLLRSSEDRKIAGVCAAFLVLAVIGGLGILL